jgi:hypothetical protein
MGACSVSTDPRAPRMAFIDALPLLGLACLLYLAMMMLGIAPSPAHPPIESGEASVVRGLDELFRGLLRGLLIVLLWIVLAILLFRRGGNSQKMSPQALVAAAILLPLSGVAAIYAANLYASYAGWAIVVPASLPPLIALYAIWMRLPVLHAALPAKIINPAAWGAILVLTLAPLPLSVIDASTYAAGEPERQRQREAYLAASERQAQLNEQNREREKAEAREPAIARFQALTPDSSLSDYLDALDSYTYYAPDEAGHDETLAKGRQIKSRQADAVALLKEGRIRRMEELWNLDIEATPAVCAAYRDALRHEAAELDPMSIDFARVNVIAGQLPNLKWLVKEHCDLVDLLAFTEKRIREVCDKPNDCLASDRDPTLAVADTLAALRRPQ